MVRYYDVNGAGHSIRCKLYCKEPREIDRVLLFVHGFGGHKDNRAAERLANTMLSKYKRTGLITFNLPCHGDDVKKKLTLADCSTYISLVVADIRQRYGTEEIYANATSFGGYLVLKYLSENGSPFRRIVLRCPAVSMYESMLGRIADAGALEKLERGKDAEVGFDKKVRIDRAFLEELREKDVRKIDFIDYAENILILHGTKDEIVPFEVSQSFAEEQLMEFIPIENADHRFQNLTQMDLAIKYTLQFLLG